MLLPVLLVTIFLSCARAERNVTADAEEFFEKYYEMNATMNVFHGLENVGKHVKEFFRLGHPLRGLLRTFNATGQATTEEVSALEMLNKLFPQTPFIYDFSEEHLLQFDYITDLKMSAIVRHLQPLLNVSLRNGPIDREVDEIKWLRRAMPDHVDAMSMLVGIDDMTRLGCRQLTKQKLRQFDQMQALFKRIESKARINWRETDYKGLKSFKDKFMYFMATRQTADGIQEIIGEFDLLQQHTNSSVMEILEKNARKIGGDHYYRLQTTCLLDTSLDSNPFNQTVVYMKLRKLHRDLLRIELLTWAMSALLENTDEDYYIDTEIAVLALERTGKFIANWTRNFQSISWPEVGITFAKQVINSVTPTSEYDATASKIRKAFEENLSPVYIYQVLVVKTSEVDVSWAVGTAGNDNYANITNFNGLDIHVFRAKHTNEIIRRAFKSKLWIKKNEVNVLKGLRHAALSNATTALSYMQEDSSIGPIYSEERFGCVVLLISKQTSANTTEIPVGFAIDENTSHKVEALRTSYSVSDKGRETIYSWKAFFFV